MTPLTPGFGDIEFGYSSAEKEGAEAPELLLNGFFDDGRLTHKALKTELFAFLGYKGSGKTALAERARLLSESTPDLFVTATTLDQFSYQDFKAVAGGSGDHQTRYPTAWGWLLLLQLIQSLEGDEGARSDVPAEYARVIQGLNDIGLVPLPRLGNLVTTSSKRAFKASLPKFFEYLSERTSVAQDLQMSQLVAVLERAAMRFPTDSRHVIFIDGLDGLITQRELQFQSLAALMHECDRLNNEFRRARKPFKFVVLCRADIFDRLPGSNVNKIRQDSSATLDWYDTPRDPDRSKLIRMVNQRAKLSLRRPVNVFEEFFPSRLDGRAIRIAILDHTRHTPRDLVQLLRKVQGQSNGDGRLSAAQVKDGLRSYSKDYFIPELRNELAGYLEQAEIDNAITLLTAVRRQRVEQRDLAMLAKELELGALDMRNLVRALFDASCIGTLDERRGKAPLYTFKYRNRNATVTPAQTLWLHPGALKGLNIERGAPPSRANARRPGSRR